MTIINHEATETDEDRVDELVGAMLGALNRLKCSGKTVTRRHLITALANLYVHHAMLGDVSLEDATAFVADAYRFQRSQEDS